MKIPAILAATHANPTGQASNTEGRGVRGFMGPSSAFEESPFPVRDCKLNKDCWKSRIQKKGGDEWKDQPVNNLACDVDTGFCVCKTRFMDADDNPFTGCEHKIDEGKCAYGACADFAAQDGEQCGSWKMLACSAGIR